MKRIDIVLPVYNEEAVIEQFHRTLLGELEPLADRYVFRLIYVLDPSTDRTFEILRTLAQTCPGMLVIHLSRRFGQQMSLVAGIDHTDSDAVIMMDADLQHPPSVIPELLVRFEDGYEVVQTVRRQGAGVGWLRIRASRLFYALQNLLSHVEITDGMADFRLISRKVARVFQTGIRERQQFLRGLFQWVGFRRAEVPFVSAERASGATKYLWRNLITFSIVGVISFSKVPLRLATLVGFVVSLLGLGYAFWLLYFYLAYGGFPSGFASLILVTLVLGGLQLMFLGVIAEYLGSIFDEVKGRPLYIVDEIVHGQPAHRD